jgi:hypothetical protein
MDPQLVKAWSRYGCPICGARPGEHCLAEDGRNKVLSEAGNPGLLSARIARVPKVKGQEGEAPQGFGLDVSAGAFEMNWRRH